jgi:hypothetical protein
MAILSTDIIYRLSGGAANSDPNAALGGAKSTTAITDNVLNNLWDDVSGDEGSVGDTEYRCFYVHNNHGTLTLQSPKIWISTDTTSANDEVDIGLGSSAVNATEQTVANESTAPTGGVTFSHPTTKTAGIALGDIPAGQHRAVWARRVVGASAAAIDNNAYNITVEGDSAA